MTPFLTVIGDLKSTLAVVYFFSLFLLNRGSVNEELNIYVFRGSSRSCQFLKNAFIYCCIILNFKYNSSSYLIFLYAYMLNVQGKNQLLLGI